MNAATAVVRRTYASWWTTAALLLLCWGAAVGQNPWGEGQDAVLRAALFKCVEEDPKGEEKD